MDTKTLVSAIKKLDDNEAEAMLDALRPQPSGPTARPVLERKRRNGGTSKARNAWRADAESSPNGISDAELVENGRARGERILLDASDEDAEKIIHRRLVKDSKTLRFEEGKWWSIENWTKYKYPRIDRIA